MESRRAESFSDGVFAVAITVLVFNLLPIAQHQITRHSVTGRAWPQYVAYVVSFLTIGIMWLNHHTMLAHVIRVDRITLVLNLFLLMGIVAVPFPTALVANSLAPNAGTDARQVAAVSYGVLLIAISVFYSAMWQYLAAHQDALADRPVRPPRAATIRFSAGGAGYVVCVFLAAFGLPDVALAGYALLAVYYLFEHLPAPGSEATSSPTEPD
jgi:uncharacterized membrane protein